MNPEIKDTSKFKVAPAPAYDDVGAKMKRVKERMQALQRRITLSRAQERIRVAKAQKTEQQKRERARNKDSRLACELFGLKTELRELHSTKLAAKFPIKTEKTPFDSYPRVVDGELINSQKR